MYINLHVNFLICFSEIVLSHSYVNTDYFGSYTLKSIRDRLSKTWFTFHCLAFISVDMSSNPTHNKAVLPQNWPPMYDL